MSLADQPTAADALRRQYETYPYPHRNPDDDRQRLRFTRIDELAALNHYCYGGRRNFQDKFRVLVAGGGTGDSTIFLAHQLASTQNTVVHLDVCETSMKIARQRARHRGIEHRIEWEHGSLLDLPTMDLEPFDYVNCIGVLHHLSDPDQGLAALRSVLHKNGAMGLMVYGQYGRAGIYQMQSLMRLVNQDETDPRTNVETTRKILKSLPPTNWHKGQGSMIMGYGPDGIPPNDTEICDLFVNPIDRAYTVDQVHALLQGAGMNLVEFAPDTRILYNPDYAFADAEIRERVKRLPLPQQQAAAELFWGSLAKHEFWASPNCDTQADPMDPENIPAFGGVAQINKVQASILATPAGEAWTTVPENGQPFEMTVRLHMDPVARKFVELIDGQRTMGAIMQLVVDAQLCVSPTEELWRHCCNVLAILRSHDFVLLRHQSVPAIKAM